MEEPLWNVGSHLQLHPKFSYRVQPLLSHVWETTLPSSQCDTWFGTTYHHEPSISKFVQKMREHSKWAKRKAEAFKSAFVYSFDAPQWKVKGLHVGRESFL